MKKLFGVLLFSLHLFAINSQPTTLAEVRANFNPLPPGQSGIGTINGITGSGLSRSSAISFGGAGNYSATNWPTSFFYNPASYFQFTIAPQPGWKFSLSQILFNFVRNSTGPTSIQIRTSVDNYASSIYIDNAIGTGNNGTGFSLSSYPQFQNVTSAITFRIYGYRASNSSGVLSLSEYTGYTEVRLPSGSQAGIILKGTRSVLLNEPSDREDSASPENELVKIFPNPAISTLSVNTSLGEDATSLMLTSSLGQTMYSNQFPNGEINQVINLEEVPQGIYILSIKSKDRMISRKILVLPKT